MAAIQRIEELIKHYGFSIREFEARIGVSTNLIQTALKRKASVKEDVLNKILQAFEEIDPVWLLTGNGQFKKLSNKNRVEKPATERIDHTNEEPDLLFVFQLLEELESDQSEQSRNKTIARLRKSILQIYANNSKLKSKLLQLSHLVDEL
ncbi:MAG: hypothetical protein WBA74_11325 [Cyclobacteriaceae bacterium]